MVHAIAANAVLTARHTLMQTTAAKTHSQTTAAKKHTQTTTEQTDQIQRQRQMYF
jgi:hypothetical protein